MVSRFVPGTLVWMGPATNLKRSRATKNGPLWVVTEGGRYSVCLKSVATGERVYTSIIGLEIYGE